MEGLGVGRIVHYTPADAPCYAAIVTQVHDKAAGLVSLAIFYPHGGTRRSAGVKPDPDMQKFFQDHSPVPRTIDTWHWPEKE